MKTQVTAAKALARLWACAMALSVVLVMPAAAQDEEIPDSSASSVSTSAPTASERAMPSPIKIAYFRPHDARALNSFETPKVEGVPYTGFAVQFGAAFTQQFQALDHENDATPNVVSGTDLNSLISIGSGFNNADANFYMDTQLARGIRVALTSYLSARHHSETWVKEGYLLIDGSPWENQKLDNLMRYLTLRVGHFEINYGDQHFRRTDNGQAMFNPLVGNLLMDAFTTEIGGEVYFRSNSILAMAAMTGGESRGQVIKPEQRSPSIMGKLGFDKQMNPDLRVRVTGSIYNTTESISNTLYSGSRAGSRYYYVIENPLATEAAQAWSGDVRPGFGKQVTAFVVNPFVKFHGLELFGNVEQITGRNANESSKRDWTHYAAEGVYRFADNHLYVAGRYNVAEGRLQGMTTDVSVDRVQVGGGWFLTQTMLAKIEYVRQTYNDFLATDIRHDAQFDGVVVEAVVSF